MVKTGKGILMQGNEACAEGAIACGMRFFAGYPITPSTEIAELCALRLPQEGGVFIQMEDELSSMAAVVGASLAGAKAMTATSGPGFSLKQENIGFACMAEVPCVVVNVQRVGPSTGMPTSPAQGDVMQVRWGTHGDHPMIALCPWSVQETYNIVIRCFNIAETLRTPVILLMDEIVGHLREKVVLPDPSTLTIVSRRKPQKSSLPYLPYKPVYGDVPAIADYGDGFRFHVTGLSHDYTGFPTNDANVAAEEIKRLHRKVQAARNEITFVHKYRLEDAEIAVFAYGGVARSAMEAVMRAREQGIRAGLFRPITIWPFPEEEVRQSLGALKAVVVAELNLGQMRLEVERCLGKGIEVIGLNRVGGQIITPDDILETLRGVK
ncbi:MAG TPA: 2-oxoacid:acceptor oxidoreductase subunit alpha [Firmicutes bacterium]|nr:2-oxoacid:acceptor oxidoreductase subunit alpha [Bacillota bacterium]